MYKFSTSSLAKLETCHPDLKSVFNTVILHYDCTIVCGYRGREEQEKAFTDGFSKVHYPYGAHNRVPSMAVDVAPYITTAQFRGIDWNNIGLFKQFGYFVLGVAAGKGVALRWGADWNRNYDTEDEKWRDWPHYELVDRG